MFRILLAIGATSIFAWPTFEFGQHLMQTLAATINALPLN